LSDIYAIHGLRIRSERELDALRATGDGATDLDVTWGAAMPATADDPDGEIIARLAFEDLPAYTVTSVADGYVFRFHRFADVMFDSALHDVVVHPHDGAADDVVPLLITGAVAAFVLEMRGECVLHASAVEHDGVAIAFAGPSGAGKTTAAALASVAGNPLVADDVLRVEFDGDADAWCYAGAPALRLRPVVVELADLVPDAPRTKTADGRLALHLATGRHERMPLAALVMPRISAVDDHLQIDRVEGADALVALTTAPRVVGWTGDHARRQFEGLAEIARRIPVFRVTIPWTPGADASVAARLLAEIAVLVA
jgi:hypothetical protein